MIEIPKKYTDPKKGEWITSAVPGLPTKPKIALKLGVFIAVFITSATVVYKFWPY